jgi:hypothetical protein
MRPRFALTLLLIVEIFCLAMVFSPGLWRSKSQLAATRTMLRNRTPETELVYQKARQADRFKQYAFCSLAALNSVALVVCGSTLHRKGLA